MSSGNPIAVAQAFVDEINEGNVEGVTELMTGDHVFIDMAGARSEGRYAMRANWENYFNLFTNYQIDIFETHFAGNDILLVGMSTGSLSASGRKMLEKAGQKSKKKKEFQGPAIWRATVRDGAVAEWQVYRDTHATRQMFNIPDVSAFNDNEPSSAGGGQGSAWYRWYVLLILTLASTFSIIDRQILSVMVGPLQRDLNISDAWMGFLMGAVFVVPYTLVTLPFGRLADRKSRKWIMVGGIASWSAITVASGFARNLWQLVFLRGGVGVGEATLGPASNSMLSDYFPKYRLPLALSIMASAPFVGIAFASMVGGPLIQAWEQTPAAFPVVGELKSWQALFIVVGLPGLLIALILATIYEPKRLGISGEFAKGKSGSVPMKEVFSFMAERRYFFILHFGGILCLSTIGWGLLTWMIEFLVRVHGMSKADAGITYGLIAFVFGIAGSIFAGWFASYQMNRNVPDAILRVIRIAAIGLLPLATTMLLVPYAWLALVLLAPITFAMAMPAGMAVTALQAIAPNELRAQMVSFYLIFVNLLSYAFGPLVIGLISDYLGGGTNLRYGLAGLAAVLYPLAAICMTLCLRHFRDALNKAEAWS